ncbi:MAG: hypothetical protein ACXV8W_04450 [Methylobacter sp.]
MIDTENSTEMIALFKSVFQTEASKTWWQWKYKEGGGKGFGYWESDSLLAHCGIFPRRIHSAGQSRLAWQLGDLMVTKVTRGRNLSRTHSPFARIIKNVLNCIPDTDNPEAITFGFPSDRAMRIGENLGFFATIDHWLEIELDHSLPNRSMLRINEASLSDQRIQTQITALWNTMSVGLSQHLVADRTAAYWIWRYAHHPTHTYRLISVRWAWWPIPFAFVVLRETTPGRWLWVDFVGPVHRFSAAALGAVIASKQFGGQSSFLFGTTMVSKAINTIVKTIRPTEIRIMANPASGTEFIERFKHRWWLMAGDTDYL